MPGFAENADVLGSLCVREKNAVLRSIIYNRGPQFQTAPHGGGVWRGEAVPKICYLLFEHLRFIRIWCRCVRHQIAT